MHRYARANVVVVTTVRTSIEDAHCHGKRSRAAARTSAHCSGDRTIVGLSAGRKNTPPCSAEIPDVQIDYNLPIRLLDSAVALYYHAR